MIRLCLHKVWKRKELEKSNWIWTKAPIRLGWSKVQTAREAVIVLMGKQNWRRLLVCEIVAGGKTMCRYPTYRIWTPQMRIVGLEKNRYGFHRLHLRQLIDHLPVTDQGSPPLHQSVDHNLHLHSPRLDRITARLHCRAAESCPLSRLSSLPNRCVSSPSPHRKRPQVRLRLQRPDLLGPGIALPSPDQHESSSVRYVRFTRHPQQTPVRTSQSTSSDYRPPDRHRPSQHKKKRAILHLPSDW